MKKIRLGDYVEIDSGYAFKSKLFNECEGLPIIRIRDVTSGGVSTYYSGEYDEKYLVKNGDLLISMDGSFIVRRWTSGIALLNQRVCRIKSKDTKVLLNDYIYHVLPRHLKYIEDKTSFVTVKHLSVKDINEIELYLPSIQIQEKIIFILNKAQELIDKRKDQLEACDELIKSQFIKMFGELKDEVDLSQYIDSLTAGKSLAGEVECKNKVLKTGSVSYDYFDAKEVKNLPLDYEPLESHLVKQGNVIISRMNTAELVGATGYVWTTPDNAYLPDRLWRAEIKNNVNPIFLWQLLIQDSTKGKIRRIASGTSGSMKNISKQGLLGIKVINVDIELQNQFAEFVQQVDKLKFEMEKSLVELENNFNSLMQRAFKGELF